LGTRFSPLPDISIARDRKVGKMKARCRFFGNVSTEVAGLPK
jgi:hypothetical protein